MTIGSVGSLSIDPRSYSAYTHRRAHSFAVRRQFTYHAANMLNEAWEELSNRFARAKGEKRGGSTGRAGKTGVPLLPNAVVTLECAAYSCYEGGDYESLVGCGVEVMKMWRSATARWYPQARDSVT
jgi:flavin reductase (DIM6/NTAB) family NADH-FMN oxidoreductase RutF